MHYCGCGIERDHAKAKELVLPSYNQGYVRAKAIVGIMLYTGDCMPKDQAKGLELLEEAASSGMVLAKKMLLDIHSDKDDANYDPAAAMDGLRELASTGDPKALYRFGCALLENEPDRQSEAVTSIIRSSESGYPEAEMKLGIMYCEGKLVKQDYAESARLLRGAGKHGLKAAYDYLDSMYEKKLTHPPDDDEWVRYSRAEAEKGCGWAMHNLGVAYNTGKGVPKDHAQAAQWFKKGVEKGYTKSMLSLGNLYQDGKGVTKDENEAIRLFRMAIELGNEDAKFNLANLYYVKRDYTEAIQLYRSCYEDDGDAEAAGMLGLMYRDGNGTERDVAKAIKHLSVAAEHNHLRFIKKLAEIYSSPKYGHEDIVQAAVWYGKAADKGDMESCRELGKRYVYGNGVRTDVRKGLELLKKAADKGDMESCRELGNLYTDGKIVSLDLNMGIHYLEKAWNKGDGPSAYKAGLILFIHDKDKEAIKWFKIASDAGFPDASRYLALDYLNGIGTDRDLQLCVKYYRRWKYDNPHPVYGQFRSSINPEDRELLDLAEQLCLAKEKYSPHFFIRRTKMYERTWTEKVKVGETIHKSGWSDGELYEYARTPIYEDREFSESYLDNDDRSVDFNNLIYFAQEISRNYSEDDRAMIAYTHNGQKYKVAEFYKGKFVRSP